MFNKKNVLVLTLGGVVVFIASIFAEEIGLCAYIHTSCIETFDPVAEIFSIWTVVLLFSLITYWMRE